MGMVEVHKHSVPMTLPYKGLHTVFFLGRGIEETKSHQLYTALMWAAWTNPCQTMHTSNYTYHDWTLCHRGFTSIVCTSTNMTQHITDKIFLKFTSYTQEGCNWRLYLRTPDLLTDTNFRSEVKKEDTWPFLPAPSKLLLPQVLQVHLLLLATGWRTCC